MNGVYIRKKNTQFNSRWSCDMPPTRWTTTTTSQFMTSDNSVINAWIDSLLDRGAESDPVILLFRSVSKKSLSRSTNGRDFSSGTRFARTILRRFGNSSKNDVTRENEKEACKSDPWTDEIRFKYMYIGYETYDLFTEPAPSIHFFRLPIVKHRECFVRSTQWPLVNQTHIASVCDLSERFHNCNEERSVHNTCTKSFVSAFTLQ